MKDTIQSVALGLVVLWVVVGGFIGLAWVAGGFIDVDPIDRVGWGILALLATFVHFALALVVGQFIRGEINVRKQT